MSSNKVASSFEELKELFPIFKVQNKTSVSRSIQLLDGHETLVPGHATGTVAANELLQIPDIKFFKLLSPTLDEVIQAGVFETKKLKAPSAEEEVVPAAVTPSKPADASSGGNNNPPSTIKS